MALLLAKGAQPGALAARERQEPLHYAASVGNRTAVNRDGLQWVVLTRSFTESSRVTHDAC